ncbi:MAG: class I SAM-dependent methyltransferase [Nitrososphaerales archaeon]
MAELTRHVKVSWRLANKGGKNMIDKLNSKIMNEEKEYYSLIKKVFDLLAPFYDTVAIPISRVRDKVVSFTDARNVSKILDVATGTGKQAFAFAKKGYDVIGIDLSGAMLKVANKKNKYGNVKFEVADAANLAFEDSSFDVSCVSFALHDMPLIIRERVLKGMVRVTKPKGMIVIVDYALPKNKISRFLIYHFIKLYEGEYYSKFIKSDLEALLRKSGIEIKEELPVLLGAGRIIKGIRMDENQQFNA